ncbi:DNA repair protein RecN [Thalassotalea euphylliae]|uniref:DNA repair protein RecN n=1 Tax=Thalassotalea euphylliae TaxID=1655234 RepID=UPI003633274F
MLLQLTVQNFAIVKSLDIDWQSGMTTITGETGAGKSIAIDALGLCLGQRATTNVVRTGAKKTDLAATFDLTTIPNAKHWLENNDLDDGNECILRRVVSAEGRSKAYINGSQVPLAQLKEIGQQLISIHGQHDHQLITKASEQLRMLDEFASHHEHLDAVKFYYKQYRQQKSELEALIKSQQEREARQQLIEYQVNELDEFAIQADEFETLEADYKRYSHSQQILSDTLQSLHWMSQDEHANALDLLRKSHDSLSSLADYDQELSNIADIINESLVQLEEANNDLRHYHDKLELDPETFSLLEERYSTAIQLAKKHQVAPEKLHECHAELAAELAAISTDKTRLESLHLDIAHTKQHYLDAAETLSSSRATAAKKLSEAITDSIRELNMEHGVFEVSISKQSTDSLNASGIDDVCFNVSINPGQAPDAMHKVASGGELSRISLAMQVILSDKVITPTLIFDEVDVGISGPTATMVGNKLKQLGVNTQVICVTHLPQVASKGHQQLFVAKLTDGEQTETTVTELSEASRVQEIARLLAGNTITDSSLQNAEELLAS